MSDSDGESKRCPVCEEHSMSDNLQSQGLIITGMKALLDGDMTTIKVVYDSMTPYDGHTAIGLCTSILNDLCMLSEIPIEFWLDKYRLALNSAQAQTSE